MTVAALRSGSPPRVAPLDRRPMNRLTARKRWETPGPFRDLLLRMARSVEKSSHSAFSGVSDAL